ITAGERIGLIGRVGSGKSTIGKLIAGLYRPASGTILLDGLDAQQFEPAEIRRAVGYLAQDADLFAGTIRDNILLGSPGATEDEIMDAARIAGVTGFTATHPLGLALPLGERGDGLSGGQRQAIALARMLLRQPKILILDEPTAAMDMTTEAQVIANLKAAHRPGQTLIIATHRISLLDLVDRIIVVDGGRIVADGPKAQVLAALKANSQQLGSTP
ncbi:MAG: hypothetical protein RL291_1168, partial [Pseudomonadota bacterium]